MKPRDRVNNDLGKDTLELGSDQDFSNMHFSYNTGERSEPEKKIKTALDSLSYPSNIDTRPRLWQIPGGGGGVRTPLDPRMDRSTKL